MKVFYVENKFIIMEIPVFPLKKKKTDNCTRTEDKEYGEQIDLKS